jgi:hypothetical protein
MKTSFKITPMSPVSISLLLFFCAAILVIFIVFLFIPDFAIAAKIISGVICIPITALFVALGYQGNRAVFSLTGQGLKIKPGFYGRTIPKEKILKEGIRVIDLKSDRQYKIRWNMFGLAWPGYLSGWFAFRNDESVLTFVTDRSSVVYIPTSDKYSVLLSVRDAAGMAETIRQWAQ